MRRAGDGRVRAAAAERQDDGAQGAGAAASGAQRAAGLDARVAQEPAVGACAPPRRDGGARRLAERCRHGDGRRSQGGQGAAQSQAEARDVAAAVPQDQDAALCVRTAAPRVRLCALGAQVVWQEHRAGAGRRWCARVCASGRDPRAGGAQHPDRHGGRYVDRIARGRTVRARGRDGVDVRTSQAVRGSDGVAVAVCVGPDVSRGVVHDGPRVQPRRVQGDPGDAHRGHVDSVFLQHHQHHLVAHGGAYERVCVALHPRLHDARRAHPAAGGRGQHAGGRRVCGQSAGDCDAGHGCAVGVCGRCGFDRRHERALLRRHAVRMVGAAESVESVVGRGQDPVDPGHPGSTDIYEKGYRAAVDMLDGWDAEGKLPSSMERDESYDDEEEGVGRVRGRGRARRREEAHQAQTHAPQGGHQRPPQQYLGRGAERMLCIGMTTIEHGGTGNLQLCVGAICLAGGAAAAPQTDTSTRTARAHIQHLAASIRDRFCMAFTHNLPTCDPQLLDHLSSILLVRSYRHDSAGLNGSSVLCRSGCGRWGRPDVAAGWHDMGVCIGAAYCAVPLLSARCARARHTARCCHIDALPGGGVVDAGDQDELAVGAVVRLACVCSATTSALAAGRCRGGAVECSRSGVQRARTTTHHAARNGRVSRIPPPRKRSLVQGSDEADANVAASAGEEHRDAQAVRKALYEPLETYEIVLVDDGSQDGTHEVALEFGREHGVEVRVVRAGQEPRQGWSGSPRRAALPRLVGALRRRRRCDEVRRRFDAIARAPHTSSPRADTPWSWAAARTWSNPTQWSSARGYAICSCTRSTSSSPSSCGPPTPASLIPAFLRRKDGCARGEQRQRLPVQPEIKDTQCGFQAVHAPTAKLVFPASHIDGWIFDVELILLAQAASNLAMQSNPPCMPSQQGHGQGEWKGLEGLGTADCRGGRALARSGRLQNRAAHRLGAHGTDLVVIRANYGLRRWQPPPPAL
ncbi:hypothetical protein L1887_59478 [Cichorium endivia]|nr:hypothetical protein L1887_59478 [Cichorium endivia]